MSTTLTTQELRELVKEAHHLLDRLKGSSAPTEAGTATPPATPDSKGYPWTEQEVRETLGFDPNDPNVKVVIHPFDGVGNGFTAAVTPKPEPADNTGGEQDDTANVVYIDGLLEEVAKELEHATAKHGPMTSAHEGYAVLKEEVDELWDLIKIDAGYTQTARKEAIQVAAMALRYVLDLNPQSVNILRS